MGERYEEIINVHALIHRDTVLVYQVKQQRKGEKEVKDVCQKGSALSGADSGFSQ